MQQLRVDNYVIDTPLFEVINRLRTVLTNGKLKEVIPGTENIVVTCPHHSGGHESKAACNIYVGNSSKIEYGYFRCFVCEAQGSFVKFVQECFDSSEDFAKQWLISNFGTLAEERVLMDDAIDIEMAHILRKHKWSPIDPQILDTMQSWHPYLAERKLSREVCEIFNVKYDPKYRQIVFPCYNVAGDLIMLPRRSIDTKTFYLDKNVEKPVYCLDYLIKNDYKKAIITEGPFDCLTAYTYGYPACATLGTISDDQIRQLNKSSLTVLYAMFDNDEAGEKFFNTLKRKLTKRIILVQVKIPNGKKDINDLSYEEFVTLLEKYKNSQPKIVYIKR